MAVARWWVRWSWAIRAANGESRGKVVGGGGPGCPPATPRTAGCSRRSPCWRWPPKQLATPTSTTGAARCSATLIRRASTSCCRACLRGVLLLDALDCLFGHLLLDAHVQLGGEADAGAVDLAEDVGVLAGLVIVGEHEVCGPD